MEAFANYFSKIDGNSSWPEIEPLFDAVMHDEVSIVTADGEKTKAQWKVVVEGLLKKGVVASGYEAQPVVDGAFHYRLTLTFPDGKVVQAASKGTLQDGKLVRVEPVDAALYSQLAAGVDS